MSERILRSGATSLTDDELVILDPMFDAGIPKRALQSDRYSEAFNTWVGHALTPVALDDLLASLRDRGLITVRDSGAYWLTARGGELWEAERRTDWNLYCSTSLGRDDEYDEGVWDLEVNAFSREIAEQDLALSRDYGLYPELKLDDLEWSRPEDSTIYWKQSPRPWRAHQKTREADPPREQMEALWAASRTWCTVRDLQLSRR